MKTNVTLHALLFLVLLASPNVESSRAEERDDEAQTLRVFIFAGQSNMVGSDSKAKDIQRFPPFVGLDMPQDKVLFSYNIGREEKRTSKGWGALQPVENVVGPELSFARVFLDRSRPLSLSSNALPAEQRWEAIGIPTNRVASNFTQRHCS